MLEYRHMIYIRHLKNDKAKCVPQLYLGLLLGEVSVSYWPFFFLCPDEQSQKSLQKPTRPSFLFLSKVANGGIELSREFGLLF